MKHSLITIIFLVNFFTLHAEINDTIFPIPDILKENVTFWKKIYTEISLHEGVIHDRDYPMVIYDRLNGDYNSLNIKARKETLSALLRSLSTKVESEWTQPEKDLYSIYINGRGDTSALKDAAERIRFQQGQKERFREGLQRSGLYLDTIRAILRSYKVPERLAYLPHVESSFNTEAYSKVGAAGLWQFMRGTGKLFGMQIDYSIDERRDPIIATVGAAKYLSSSYAELKSWPLAITSYNHGIYGMKRAVAQTGSSDIAVIIQKYSSPSFRFASSNFYGCFLAASEIAANYTTYFPSITLSPALNFTDVTLTHFISPDIICVLFELTNSQFSALNPAIRPTVFEQKKRLPKGFVIHLPSQFTPEIAMNKLLNIPDSLKSTEPERPNYYSVAKGDNLYKIATRLGVSVQQLALENNITKYNRIHAGQVLRVPGSSSKVTPTVTVAVAEKTPAPRISSVNQEVKPVTPKTDARLTNDAVAEIAQAEIERIIPPDETTMIATRPELFPTPVPPVQIKQPVNVPILKGTVRKEEPPVAVEQLSDSLRDIVLAPALAEPEISSEKKPVLGINFDVSLYNLDATLTSGGSNASILVSIDETIGHYADWLGIATWQIRKLNDMGRTSDIRVNRKILIPVNHTDALERFSSARLEYHMAIEEDFYAQYKISDVKAYTIKRGQALWHLCNEGETPVPLWLLKKYNKQVDLNKLTSGMTVWIPSIAELSQDEIEHRSTIKTNTLNEPYRLPAHITSRKNELTP